MAKKKKAKKHFVATGKYEGILSRNKDYRKDAWGYLRGAVANYSNTASALAGVIARDNRMGRPGGLDKFGRPLRGKTQAQRAATYSIGHFNSSQGAQNFMLGRIPYPNQAHHVLPCEVFYEPKWDAKHLDVVLDCPYNINNPKNIIYLPQGEAFKGYHLLPDHSSGHPAYNDRLVEDAKVIYDMVDEALDAEDCKEAEDLRERIKKKLEQIESTNFNKLKNAGPTSMS